MPARFRMGVDVDRDDPLEVDRHVVYSRVVSLYAAVERAFETFAERPALVGADRRLSYAELHDLTLRWARAIRDPAPLPATASRSSSERRRLRRRVLRHTGGRRDGRPVERPAGAAGDRRAGRVGTRGRHRGAGGRAGSRPLEPEGAAADVAVLLFTSGTTGGAKGAELTHDGLLWNAQGIVDAFHLVRTTFNWRRRR